MAFASGPQQQMHGQYEPEQPHEHEHEYEGAPLSPIRDEYTYEDDVTEGVAVNGNVYTYGTHADVSSWPPAPPPPAVGALSHADVQQLHDYSTQPHRAFPPAPPPLMDGSPVRVHLGGGGPNGSGHARHFDDAAQSQLFAAYADDHEHDHDHERSHTQQHAQPDLEAGDPTAIPRRHSLTIDVGEQDDLQAVPMQDERQVDPLPNLLAVVPVSERALRPGSERDSGYMYRYGSYGTSLLLFAHLGLFLAEFGVGNHWTLESWHTNPAGGPSYDQLDTLGGKLTFKILGKDHLRYSHPDGMEGWRLLTSPLWHAGVATFVPSMVILFWLGSRLEREYGPLRIVLLWLCASWFGTTFSAIMCVDLLTVSGTAGIFGLIGARLMDIYLYRHWYRRKANVLAVINCMLVAAAGLVLGLLPLVDNWAHVGALPMGALCAGALFTGGWREPPLPDAGASAADLSHADARTRRYRRIRIGCVCAIVIAWAAVLLLLFIAVRELMEERTDAASGRTVSSVWCPECNQLQCMNASPWTCRPAEYYR